MRGRGFTLMELMIALAIISALVAIIYPSYSQYTLKAKRVEAQSTMQELSQKLATYKISNGNFRNVDLVPLKCYSEKLVCVAVIPSSISAVIKTEIR